VSFGLALLALGGFLLGGAWTMWRRDPDSGRRTRPQVVVALILLLAALLATAAGILRLV
jgi:hypothetical protein